jgi:hypothetical protein
MDQKPASERLAERQLKRMRDRQAGNTSAVVGFFAFVGSASADIEWSTVLWGTLGAMVATQVLVLWCWDRSG